MPEVLGRPQADVEADLKALKIKYALYPLVNGGSYVAGTVARSDTDKGTVVEIGKTTVTLYIAGEAPKQPDSSSSSQTAPLPGTGGHAASGIARHHGAVRRAGAGGETGGGARPKADAAPRSR